MISRNERSRGDVVMLNGKNGIPHPFLVMTDDSEQVQICLEVSSVYETEGVKIEAVHYTGKACYSSVSIFPRVIKNEELSKGKFLYRIDKETLSTISRIISARISGGNYTEIKTRYNEAFTAKHPELKKYHEFDNKENTDQKEDQKATEPDSKNPKLVKVKVNVSERGRSLYTRATYLEKDIVAKQKEYTEKQPRLTMKTSSKNEILNKEHKRLKNPAIGSLTISDIVDILGCINEFGVSIVSEYINVDAHELSKLRDHFI